ncbi:GNAT family N-acetyltransferase [Kutzneria sp. CA-103260]|uniref:GNAT family N-acetyltransferase n=1 Tax=Kutzneria sp. CA-103260 TaxID=2802641 RepID=UPI001BA67E5C|nr:GNAT family N-acetyltransferase [Kutzneria sp. CA-103260]QUQ69092.1 N-acetyltransferase GCN5 [Kutzneria sp. CA-103260]
MDTIAELELLCADAWPALVDERLGQWRLRAAGGFTGRANTALTIGDPGMPVSDALAATAAFAARRGIEPKAHVIQGSETERRIEAAGWQPATDHPAGSVSQVMTGPLPVGGPVGEILDKPSRQWWEFSVGEPTAAQKHVLGTGPRLGFGYVEDTAVVRGCVVDTTLHIARLSVAPAARRQGVARRLLAALGTWARECGADRSVLQVEINNTAAIRLYEGLGFTEHHRYGYWKP